MFFARLMLIVATTALLSPAFASTDPETCPPPKPQPTPGYCTELPCPDPTPPLPPEPSPDPRPFA